MSDIYAIVFMAVFAGFCIGIVLAPRPKGKRKRKNDEIARLRNYARLSEGARRDLYRAFSALERKRKREAAPEFAISDDLRERIENMIKVIGSTGISIEDYDIPTPLPTGAFDWTVNREGQSDD